MMSPEFHEVVESLHENYERLIRADKYTKGMFLPLKGVYSHLDFASRAVNSIFPFP